MRQEQWKRGWALWRKDKRTWQHCSLLERIQNRQNAETLTVPHATVYEILLHCVFQRWQTNARFCSSCFTKNVLKWIRIEDPQQEKSAFQLLVHAYACEATFTQPCNAPTAHVNRCCTVLSVTHTHSLSPYDLQYPAVSCVTSNDRSLSLSGVSPDVMGHSHVTGSLMYFLVCWHMSVCTVTSVQCLYAALEMYKSHLCIYISDCNYSAGAVN